MEAAKVGAAVMIWASCAAVISNAAAQEVVCKTMAGVVYPCPSSSPSRDTGSSVLGTNDLTRIVATYKANQIRFSRDFKSREFAGDLPFKDASESVMEKGSYRIGLGGGSFMSDLDCTVSDASDIQRMSDWNPGDQIHVSGTIKDVTFGSVELEPCSMSKR